MVHNFLIHSPANRHLGCFHVLAYCKQCCNEHWGTHVYFNSGFLSVYAQQWDCWVISAMISLNKPSAFFFLSSLWIPTMNGLLHLMVSDNAHRLFFHFIILFSFSFFFFALLNGKFQMYCLHRFTDSFAWMSPLLKLSIEFFNLIIVFCNARISVCF